ncbi:MAG: hypothetical protein ABI947_08835 [Chloroflexota bacterium]
MAIIVKWFDEAKTICILQRDENWTWKEFDDANVQSNHMIKEVSHPVNLIVDGADRLPPGYPIRHFRQALMSKPNNLKALIIVISNPFGRTIFNAMSRLNQRQSRLLVAVQSSKEAFELVKPVAATV